MAVSGGPSTLSVEISHQTNQTAYELFTPNKSGQRLPPTYYRGLGRVSVPVWLVVLSDQLPVVALVSRYLTNKLIGREPIPERNPFPHQTMRSDDDIRY